MTIPEHGFARVELNSGIKFIYPPKAWPPYRIILVNLESTQETVAQQNWAPLLVPPGRYRLDWWEDQHRSKRTTLAEDLIVEPGTLLEVEM